MRWSDERSGSVKRLGAGSALAIGVAATAGIALAFQSDRDASAAAALSGMEVHARPARAARPAVRTAGVGRGNLVLTTADRGTVRLRIPRDTETDNWRMRAAEVVGDVNGDGVPDIAVAVDHVQVAQGNRGQCPLPAVPHESFVQVIFGGRLPALINVADARVPGFRISAPAGTDDFGVSLEAAGDVNGDRLADLVIGAPGDADRPGSAYVVYGQASSSAIDISRLDGQGFRIDGPGGEIYQAGMIVAGGGDVNGDGHADVLIGAQWRTPELVEWLKGSSCRRFFFPRRLSARGVVYVVFGGDGRGSVALGNLGSGGFSIGDSWKLEDVEGDWLANAGDVNGDGLADVLIGTRTGALVVFGRRSTDPVNPDGLADGGLELRAPASRRVMPVYRAIAGIGDVNADGFGDFLIGTPSRYRYPAGSPQDQAPSAYVIFGRRSPDAIDVRKLGSGGIAIEGTRNDAGFRVAGLGDLNGDKVPDFGVLAPNTPFGGGLGEGSLYALFGKRSTRPLRLDSLGFAGARLDGSRYGSVYAAGGTGALLGTGRQYVLVSDRYVSAELVPFAPRIAPAAPRLGPSVSLGPKRVTSLTYGFGSVWVLARSGSRRHSLVYRLNATTNRLVGRPARIDGRGRVIATARGSIWTLMVPPHRETPATLVRLDPRTRRILLRATVGGPGRDVDPPIPAETINEGFGSLWVTYGATGSVYRVDPATGKTIATIEVGHYPQALTFAAGRVWVADREDGAVREIDPVTNRVVGSSLDITDLLTRTTWRSCARPWPTAPPATAQDLRQTQTTHHIDLFRVRVREA